MTKGYLEDDYNENAYTTSGGSGGSGSGSGGRLGPMKSAAITVRIREKNLLLSVIQYIQEQKKYILSCSSSDDDGSSSSGDINKNNENKFLTQFDQRLAERKISDERDKIRREWMLSVDRESNRSEVLLVQSVDLGEYCSVECGVCVCML